MKKIVFDNEENKKKLIDAGINVNVTNFQQHERRIIEILSKIKFFSLTK